MWLWRSRKTKYATNEQLCQLAYKAGETQGDVDRLTRAVSAATAIAAVALVLALLAHRRINLGGLP